MIQISKSQATYLRETIKGITICSTSKQKSKGRRKKYYVEETSKIKKALKNAPLI